jgi:hypothetical protein
MEHIHAGLGIALRTELQLVLQVIGPMRSPQIAQDTSAPSRPICHRGRAGEAPSSRAFRARARICFSLGIGLRGYEQGNQPSRHVDR